MNPLAKSLLLALSATAASTAFCVAQAYDVPTFSAPGIPQAGYPDFAALNFSASVSGSANSGYTLTISEDDPNIGVFNFKHGAYLVSDETVQLVAHFDATGHLLTNQNNSIEIEGSVAAWNHPSLGAAPSGYSWSGTTRDTLLFYADLTGVGVDSKHEALGFSTTDFYGWASQFANPNAAESLWLFSLLGSVDNGTGAGKSWDAFLTEIKNHTALTAASFSGIESVATVPLPATLLMLMSGLVGLGFASRQRTRVTA
jgi:hypothetical protein